MIEDRHLDEYKTVGYTIIENFLTPEELRTAQWETLKLKRWLNIYKMEGKPRSVGTGEYWKAIECAGTMSPKLMELYTSKKQYDTATVFLETDEIYLFNDEVVVKYPNDNWEFMVHTDNEWGPDPDAAKRGDYKSVNICWMLDDMTRDNGAMRFFSNKKIDTPLAKAGDVVVFDGNTVHASTANKSDKIRRCWATVYTTKNIGNFEKGFYTERFHAR